MLGTKATVVFGALAAWALLVAPVAGATSLDFIPVGDPLEDELRVLDVSGAPLRLPRMDMRPIQVVDLPALNEPLSGPAEISRQRLLRSLARDRGLPGIPGTTPRLLEIREPDDQVLEVSAGLEGRGTVGQNRNPRFEDGSGLHMRFAAQVGRWLAYSDIAAAHVEGSSLYSERLFNNDASLVTDQALIGYTSDQERWAASLGRGRWNWGPGDEASLILSKTSPSFTALTFRLRIEALRADGMILNATLQGASGMQLAAHRLEWQPRDDLRLGYTEAVRYRASSWEPLYVVGVIPFSIVQSLMVKDEPESLNALRNNVIAGVDAAWRMAPGTRLYSELLIDDLRTDNSNTLSKYAYQAGWEGVGIVFGSRVTWNAEITRLTRFVYTSFNDRVFSTAGEPLGFPTGPDSRRVHVRATWDPSVAWQVFGLAARTDQGESGLDSSYTPGSPRVDVSSFEGVVETTRQIEAGLRYWPASGIDLAVSAGVQWLRNPDHVEGVVRREPYAALNVRLIR